jgi:ribonuclease P protein component
MLPKALRYSLRDDRDFFRESEKNHGGFFTFYVKRIMEASPGAQAAIIIPRKAIALASHRNQRKRWLREALSSTLPKFPTLNLAIVVMIHREFRAEDVQMFEKKLEQLLKARSASHPQNP